MKKIHAKTESKNLLQIPIIILIVCFAFCLSASAHSGRTDANGGHWDRKAGTYHYHGAPKAGTSSESTSSKPTSTLPPVETPAPTPTSTPTPTPTPTLKPAPNVSTSKAKTSLDNKEKTSDIEPVFKFLILLTVFFIGGYLICCIYLSIKSLCISIKENMPKYKIKLLNEKLNEFQNLKNRFDKTYTKLYDLKSGFKIPASYEIGKDHLPKEKNISSGWGHSFTVYTSYRGRKLHSKLGCCSAWYKSNICEHRYCYSNPNFMCKICTKDFVLPDLSWYDKYLKITELKYELQSIARNAKELQAEISDLYKRCNPMKSRIFIMFGRKHEKALQEVNKKFENLFLV